MANELGEHGIRVNCVNPIVTLTDMAILAWSDPAKSAPCWPASRPAASRKPGRRRRHRLPAVRPCGDDEWPRHTGGRRFPGPLIWQARRHKGPAHCSAVPPRVGSFRGDPGDMRHADGRPDGHPCKPRSLRGRAGRHRRPVRSSASRSSVTKSAMVPIPRGEWNARWRWSRPVPYLRPGQS